MIMKMKNNLSNMILLASVSILAASCGKLGKSSKGGLPKNDGQLHGVSLGNKYTIPRPPGMIYVPQGTFHMGANDEDISYSFTSRNRQISINGFWMDATEITNNEYRQFVYYVRDSIALEFLTDTSSKGKGFEERRKVLKWNNRKWLSDNLSGLMIDQVEFPYAKEIDVSKIKFAYRSYDYKKAAEARPDRLGDKDYDRKDFIIKESIPIYPDTLVWVRDFSYSFNEPQSKQYFSHPAFQNYPVVGVSWRQATAFCKWRSNYLNEYLDKNKKFPESDFRLPTEAEWEYAARGGRSQSNFPWGSYYLRNKKGCILANFKPGRGNYPEDGGFYTVRADAYWPNDFGLYNMSGNVAEWTSSLYDQSSYNFMHDMNPDVRYNAAKTDPPRMRRKVIRGGSWKDVGYYLQTGVRAYEYQDTAKSYIGFRCVIDLPAAQRAQTNQFKKP
jgi:formylglycine-generating enzyme